MSERRVAVVTGASSGIGEATARELARQGWLCVVLARRADRLEALAAEIDGEWEVCDVRDRAQVDEVAARVLDRHPAISLLVNNAGVPGRGSFVSRRPRPSSACSRRTTWAASGARAPFCRASVPPRPTRTSSMSSPSRERSRSPPPARTRPRSTHSWRSRGRSQRRFAPRGSACTRSFRASSRRRGSSRGRRSRAHSCAGS